MVLSSVQYEQIRELLLYSGRRFNVEELKAQFEEIINSQRVYEKINSLAYLFKILEKRDALGPAHLNNLIQIINKVDPSNANISHILYGRVVVNAQETTVNNAQNIPGNNNQVPGIRVLQPIPLDVVERIHEMIRSKIGRKWRELARALCVQEGDIDNLEFRYRNISKMVLEILTVHKEKCGNNFERWRSELQRALVIARRTDLSEEIDDILTFNHMEG